MVYEKNQLLTIDITDMTADGEGIGKTDGYPFFVKDTIIGDQVQIRITRVKKNYAYGRLEKVVTPSPFRIETKCPFHRQCGGCQIQAMSYQRQLQFKESKVKNNLIRIGGFTPKLLDKVMEPIVGMEEPFYYRNKALYPIGADKEGNPVAGFYAGRTHSIIANTDCSLGVKENKEILEKILSYMKENHVTAYDEAAGRGLVRHVLIRKGFQSGEIMVCLVINFRAGKNTDFLPNQEKLIDSLSNVKGMTSISVSINRERTNVVMGKEIHTIWGKDRIKDTIYVRSVENDFAAARRGITFSISPLSFYQVNPIQTEKLYSLALSYAGITGKEIVWDLYCGIGTISLFLASKAKQVYGVEIVPQAIEDAKRNAAQNGIENVEFFVGSAEEVFPEKYEKDGIRADVVVVDPPRKGCDRTCLDTVLKIGPDKIVYVSCDSATLARDLRILCEDGYEIERVRAVDMFPMTVHVETVCLLSKHIELSEQCMAEDCAALGFVFRGTLKKVHIISNIIGYGPMPKSDKEVEQHLTINDEGCVWFSGYNFGYGGEKYEKARSRNFRIEKADTDRLFKALAAYFGNRYDEIFGTDIGNWMMELTNTEGITYKFCGSLCADFDYEGTDLSDLVRNVIGMDDLYVFNGNCKSDIINKITLDYHRVTKIKPGQRPEGAAWEFVTWDYTEHLIIDRATETLEHILNIGTGCKVSHKYEIEGGIESLLEQFDAEDLFSHIEGNPDDVIDSPNETKDYRITIDYKKNTQRVIKGSYDKNGLPEDFADFAEEVFEFIRFYGMGEILDPSVYGKIKRCQSEYIFCSVTFDEGCKSYYYLTDDDSIEVGDFVLVPAGKDNREVIVEVVNIEYFNEEDVPLPVEKTKKIIRKCTNDEFNLPN